MMNALQMKTARMAGAVLGGGIVAGALLALTVPTTMKRPGENWRQLIGLRDAPEDSTSVIAFEAPPEDLTPVRWETAGQEYPLATVPREEWVDPEPYRADEQPSEQLPVQLIDSRELDADLARADTDDEADSSARAASEAAADVRALEPVADGPAHAESGQANPPEATTIG